MLWIVSVFGISIGTAILPVFSLELYLLGLAASRPDLAWWILGPVAALGQLLGKSVHYLAARDVVTLPRLLRWPLWQKLPAAWILRFQRQCDRRPITRNGIMLASALGGIPPFGATVIAAGIARIPLSAVLPMAALGRFTRYCVLAAIPTLIQPWLWPW